MILVSDIYKKEWSMQETEDDSFGQVFLRFSFVINGALPVLFKIMNFGYEVFYNNKIIFSEKLPKNSKYYRSSDQKIIYSTFLENLKIDEEYMIHVWCENGEDRWEESFSFLGPRPTCPNPSWIYDEVLKNWVAPKPKPNTSPQDFWIWNEEKKDWFLDDMSV